MLYIEIEESDKFKKAFEVDGRVYEWNSMIMEFEDSPQIMHLAMSKVLDEMIDRGVNFYMDLL